jgi:phosphonate transport system substrate-binding protein
MGPLQYVIAHDQTGAYPILGEVYNGKPYYTSRIFVRKDSGITSLADLEGKSIAFVDPISSSGYLYPLQIFRNAKLIDDKPEKFFKRMYFAGGDEQAIRSVYNKFVDAAGISQYAFSLLRAEERDAVTYVGESEPSPSHCVVVRKDLHADTVARLQQALLALNDGPNRLLLKSLYSVDGYVTVTHDTFREVEELARSYGFIK